MNKLVSGKRLSIVMVLALALTLAMASLAFAAQPLGEVANVDMDNFNQPIGSSAIITATPVDADYDMYQWWVIADGEQDSKCLGSWSKDNTFNVNTFSAKAGEYGIYLNIAKAADFKDGAVDPANVKTTYFKVFIGKSVTLDEAVIQDGKLVVAASSNFANPDYQFWYELPNGEWKCSWYGEGASRAIDLEGATGSFKVIAYAKDKDFSLDNLKWTVWSDVETATVSTEELQVVEVSAINAKEVEVKFSKAVDENTVVNGGNLKTTNLDVTPIGTAKTVATIAAELSEDGKTLTLTAGTNYFDGQYAVVVEPTVTDLDGNEIETYSAILTVKDTVRPTIEKIEYTDFQTAKVTFSEPLASLGTATPSHSDITVNSLATDGKSVTIDLSNTNVELNKDYTVTIIGAKDFAGNLISPNPVEITVKKVKADTEKPTVEAITVVNDKLFTIKFSEKLNATLPTVSVSNSTGATLTVTKDINDPTVYNVSSNNSLAGVSGAAIAKTVTVSGYTDLSGNDGDQFSKVVTFVADAIDPKVVSSRVEKINGVEHLIVTFDENVVPQDAIAINGKVVKDFVETDKTPAITTNTSTNFELYKPVNNKSKAVQLDLTSLSDGDYTLNLPVGLVKDEAGNDNEAKTVTFTRTSDVDVDKPALVAAYDGNGIQVDDNNTVTVKFDKKLDVATALNLNNYVIEGVQIKSAIFTANPDASGHAIVRLTLEDGSVDLSGDRAVTIKNIKSADGVVMDTVTTTEEFTENVRPTVKSAKLTAEDEITLTFSEKVELGSSVDFDVFVGSETTARTITSTTLDPTDGESVVIKLNTALTADDLAKDIVVKKASTNDVKDDPAGNKLSFTSIVVTK